MAQSYPYYSINRVEGGVLVKLFKHRQYKSLGEASNSFSIWKANHPNIEGQYVILHYTSYYTSRICMICEGDTITWID